MTFFFKIILLCWLSCYEDVFQLNLRIIKNKFLEPASSTQVGSSTQQQDTKTNKNSEVEAIKKKLSSAISLFLEDINLTEISALTSSKLYKLYLFSFIVCFFNLNTKFLELNDKL